MTSLVEYTPVEPICSEAAYALYTAALEEKEEIHALLKNLSHHSVQAGFRSFQVCHTEGVGPLDTYSLDDLNNNPICKTYRKLTDPIEKEKFTGLASWAFSEAGETPHDKYTRAVEGIKSNIAEFTPYLRQMLTPDYKLPQTVFEETAYLLDNAIKYETEKIPDDVNSLEGLFFITQRRITLQMSDDDPKAAALLNKTYADFRTWAGEANVVLQEDAEKRWLVAITTEWEKVGASLPENERSAGQKAVDLATNFIKNSKGPVNSFTLLNIAVGRLISVPQNYDTSVLQAAISERISTLKEHKSELDAAGHGYLLAGGYYISTAALDKAILEYRAVYELVQNGGYLGKAFGRFAELEKSPLMATVGERYDDMDFYDETVRLGLITAVPSALAGSGVLALLLRSGTGTAAALAASGATAIAAGTAAETLFSREPMTYQTGSEATEAYAERFAIDAGVFAITAGFATFIGGVGRRLLTSRTVLLKEIGRMKLFRKITGVSPENWDALIEGKNFDNVYRLIATYYDRLPPYAKSEYKQLGKILKQNKWLTRALNEIKDSVE